jgi:hypothetical protein
MIVLSVHDSRLMKNVILRYLSEIREREELYAFNEWRRTEIFGRSYDIHCEVVYSSNSSPLYVWSMKTSHWEIKFMSNGEGHFNGERSELDRDLVMLTLADVSTNIA